MVSLQFVLQVVSHECPAVPLFLQVVAQVELEALRFGLFQVEAQLQVFMGQTGSTAQLQAVKRIMYRDGQHIEVIILQYMHATVGLQAEADPGGVVGCMTPVQAGGAQPVMAQDMVLPSGRDPDLKSLPGDVTPFALLPHMVPLNQGVDIGRCHGKDEIPLPQMRVAFHPVQQ
ncbi:hypothetical protein D3C81_1516860 [compost metagenome]